MPQNILLIITDQQQADALGCVDSSYATPNLDALAASGVRFSNYYCASGQCTPSRAAMMTGLYPHQVGVLQIGHALSPRFPSVGRAFSAAGYLTAYFGKWHLFWPETDHGFNVVDYREDGIDHGSIDPEEPSQQGLDARTTARALNFLNDIATDQPFFLVVSWYAPHPPFRAIEPYAARFPLEAMPVPSSFYLDDLATKPPWQQERAASDECRLTAELIRQDARAYRSQIAYLDWNVGRLREVLARRGLDKNTVIVFTTDHGDMQGSHRLRYKGVLPYEELYRIPLIISDPRRSSSQVIPTMAANVSLPATLLDLAGIPGASEFHGPSLVPLWQQTAPVPPAAQLHPATTENEQKVYIEHWRAYWGYHPFRGVITPQWKYVYYFHDGVAEFYDRTRDPLELVNQADHPDYRGIVRRLREEVDAWWENTGGLSVKPIPVKTAGWIDTEH